MRDLPTLPRVLLAWTLALSACAESTGPDAPVDGADDSFLSGGKADLSVSNCGLTNLLTLVNAADLSVDGLKSLGVHTRAAKAIYAFRAGPDGQLGGPDDGSYGTLDTLDATKYVGPVALNQLIDAAGGNACALPAFEVILNAPFCDSCSSQEKTWLKSNSPVTRRVVELLDGAQDEVLIAQFTFSVREIERAILRAYKRGVTIRIAMDAKQGRRGSLSRRLADAGVDVAFVEGKGNTQYAGLQHAKFMVVDSRVLLTGSSNWSSTGTSINEENTTVTTDPTLLGAFMCHFEVIYAMGADDAADCAVPGRVEFSPSGGPNRMISGALKGATRSIDVMVHQLLFTSLQKKLAQAAERGVRVRIVLNVGDDDMAQGKYWDRLRAAGGEIRYKRVNPDLYQLMHHKLAIIDDEVLINGSGNWSGSAFFNNYENYVRYDEPGVVAPFVGLFERVWRWSLTPESLEGELDAGRQHAAERTIYFGNLHAHYHANGGRYDDGKAQRLDENGEPQRISVGANDEIAASRAFEYARDYMDFMALTPHVKDGDDDANMQPEGYAGLIGAARGASDTEFLALAGMEWSTNSTGNHLNILGTTALAKVERGRFDLIYEQFLPEQTAQGERPFLILNHPRTFRKNLDTLKGSWDQVFDTRLTDIPNNSQRKKKFNDFGLDDYAPLSLVRDSWISGEVVPDRATVNATMRNIAKVTAPYAKLMEITVGRGTELGGETPVNPSLSLDDEGQLVRYVKIHSDMDYYLSQGFKLAPAANHDNHYANWGAGHTTRTAIAMPALSESALLDAVHSRAVYASEDENLEVRFYAAGHTPMGGSLRTLESRTIGEFYLDDPDYDGSYSVRVFGGKIGGEVQELQTFSEVGAGIWQGVALDARTPGEWFFYLEIHQLDADRMAWTAPIWIERL